MKNTRKKYAVLAVLMAASMLATGCSGGDDSAAEDTTVSVNVIGGEEGSDAQQGESASTAVVTGENGEVMTGANGNVLTEPVTEAVPTETLSEEEILAAITGTTSPEEKPQVNVSHNSGGVRYAYETLTDKEKELYDMIAQGIKDLRFKVCAEDAYSLEEWVKIYGLVYNQEPQLFYMGSKVKVGKLFYLTKDTEAINQMQQSIDAVADKLVAEANGKSSTFDKLKVFHDYLALNSTFELKEDGSKDYNATIYNAFGSGDAQGNIQCAGYAKAVQYLCDKAGIPCMVVTGETSEGQTHAWNVVDVDGEWYNFDVTWDDPILSTPVYSNVRYNYFLVPDSEIHNITHFRVSQKKTSSGSYITYFTPPACTASAENYFIKNDLVYDDFASAEAALKAAIEKAAKDGSRTAQVRVATKDIYNKLYDARMSYNDYAKTFSGVKGLSDVCNETMLIIELDVIYS
ncbi:MAG: hypothetical protein IJZ61_07235 [Oscillospiraceae bacterium]|nr:hypothetical protein [Oscillospiraceae bacterium]